MKVAVPALACQRARADVFAFSPRIGAVLCASSAVLLGQMMLVAGADPISSGKAAFAVCSTCHSLSGEGNSGLSDARQAQRPSSNPQKQVPGNRMPFPEFPTRASKQTSSLTSRLSK